MSPRRETASTDPGGTVRHALVIAAGEAGERSELDASWPGWDDDVDLVIAADGGYRSVARLGFRPDLLIGDLDSLDAATQAHAAEHGVTVQQARPDKDASDTELAVLEARRRGADRITVLGGLGGPRLDHALANIWLLGHPELAGARTVLVSADARVSVVSAPDDAGLPVTRRLDGRPRAMITLLPLGGDVTGITTQGLRYPLRDEPLRVGPARGLSNVRTSATASVTVRAGRLLVVEGVSDDARLSSEVQRGVEHGDPEGR
jgi:thiamine pyrophosphokinase